MKFDIDAEILTTIGDMEKRLSAATTGGEIQHRSVLISPGNEEGGITTVVEKALGGIYKAGTGPISGVVGCGEYPASPGLKAAMEMIGLSGGAPRLPLLPTVEADWEELWKILTLTGFFPQPKV